ncbi:MAG: pyruvate kinase [Clostridiales bacterium]|nr:pyruvate kinase [Clostridiales bacterium]MDY6117306.1 pyruvate kinase [Anaerovoracaceae bacterium]
MNRTKIICTLGPASESAEIIEKLFMFGMNVGRINFSHGTHEEHRKKIETFREVRDKLGIAAAVLLDTKGPEIRIGKIAGGKAYLEKGNNFVLTIDEVIGDDKKAYVKYGDFTSDVSEGTTILLDDGKIVMRADKVTQREVFCTVLVGGFISDNKGINLPNTVLSMDYLSPVDKQDLKFGVEMDVDYIAASFVRSKEDILKLRGFVDELGGKDIKIIAKIENKQGLKNFSEILKVADGIMVARGDMGVEMPYERLPGIQKKIISRCLELGKIAITATQMLESMIVNPTPTRAETSDVANAVFDGSSAVMLSGETAAGQYPVEACASMRKIANQAEEDLLAAEITGSRAVRNYSMNDLTNAVGHSACTMAYDIDAGAIMAITKTGYTATKMSKFRPVTQIIAMTPYDKTYHQMALEWGVLSVRVDYKDNLEELMTHCIQIAQNSGLVRHGEKVVITCGMPLDVPGNTNIIRVEEVK